MIIINKSSVMAMLQKKAGIVGKSIFPTAPIPAISAAMLSMIAGQEKISRRYSTHFG